MTKEQISMCQKLRDETGIGVMHCKKCLVFYHYDYDLALKNIHNFSKKKLIK